MTLFDPQRIIPVLLTAFNFGVMILGQGMGGRKGYLLAGGGFLGAYLYHVSSLKKVARARLPGTTEMGILWLYGIYFIARHCVEMFIARELFPDSIVQITVENAFWLLTLWAVFYEGKRLEFDTALISLVFGIAFVAAINLAADRFMGSREDASWSESRFGNLQGRWLPPYARSAAGLSMLCTMAAATMLGILLTRPRLNLDIWVVPFSIVGIGVCAAVTIKCEFRAHILAILAALSWAIFPKKLRLTYPMMGIVGFFLMPMLFIGNLGYSLLNALNLQRYLSQAGSDTEGSETLSDRTELWRYGWQRLFSGETGIFGDGPGLRDSSPGVGGWAALNPNRIGFHNALLDILVPHGPFLGLIILVLFIGALVRLRKFDRIFANIPEAHRYTQLGLMYFTIWLSLSIMDGSVTSLIELFLVLMIPIVGLNRKLYGMTLESQETEVSPAPTTEMVPAN
jgi:hypothetical protein